MESSISSFEGSWEKTGFQGAKMRILKPIKIKHYSNKATPPNSATPWANYIQTITFITKQEHFIVIGVKLSVSAFLDWTFAIISKTYY